MGMLMGAIALVLFWVLLFLGRHELGAKWILILIAIWAGGLIAVALTCSPYPRAAGYFFMSYQAVLDIILILVIFKGDLPIH
jgi:hypothetical protein